MANQRKKPEEYDLERRAESISNVTYTAPTETGEVQSLVDEVTVGRRLSSLAALTGGDVPRVGRNEPCPCRSGKKYKHCHGKLA